MRVRWPVSYTHLDVYKRQVEYEGKNLERERLDFIYRLKTSALIEASMMVGAVLAGASDEKIALLERVAGKVGLAFQIQDDILDVVSTTETLGKPVGSDEENRKTTYVTVSYTHLDVYKRQPPACWLPFWQEKVWAGRPFRS